MTVLKIAFALFVLTASLYSPSLISVESEHLESHHVESISIILDGKPSETTQNQVILSRMRTQAGQLFSQQEFDEDLKVLAKEYEQIEPAIEVEDQKLKITLHLQSKPKIKAIVWEGNKQIPQDKLEKELDIRPGMIFDRQTFNKAFNKLKNFYVKKGYFEAALTYKIQRDLNKEITVQIYIKEGRNSAKLTKSSPLKQRNKHRTIVRAGVGVFQVTRVRRRTAWWVSKGVRNRSQPLGLSSGR